MVQRAFLVGIDQYPDPRNNLNSCVADTEAFRSMLLGTFGFSDANVRMLHNTDATLANVREGLGWLFAGATAGDELVYMESSHGYRYPQGDTMIEVLCLYDAFLEDHEFSSRTEGLPHGTFTAVLDACHSGGMDKVFFPDNTKVTVARAKIFQPDPLLAAVYSQLGQVVSKFKLFGRSTSGDVGTLAKEFTPPPARAPVMPISKDSVDVELNGVLFAACQADQTAAAGSPATNNLSAFTFALTDQLDETISVSDLNQRIVTRLSNLRMNQTPIVEVPTDQQILAQETFITMQTPGAGPSPVTGPEQGPGTALDDVIAQLRALLSGGGGGKEFTMNPATLDQVMAQIKNELSAALGQPVVGATVDANFDDAASFAGSLLSSIRTVATLPDVQKKVQGKAAIVPLTDATLLQNKDWLSDVFTIVQDVGPLIVNAFTKDFTNTSTVVQGALQGVDPARTKDKDWIDFVVSTVTQLAPLIAQAITGQKDFRTADAVPAIQVPAKALQDKNWFSDAVSAATQLIPVILPEIMKLV